jgi:glycosyltransferase involved in cell wall biosynthesis
VGSPDAAGSRDLVEDGTTGRLCPPGDVDAFTETARTLIADASLRNRMGATAHERAQDFTWPSVLGQMNQYYDEVLEHSSQTVMSRSLAPASMPA